MMDDLRQFLLSLALDDQHTRSSGSVVPKEDQVRVDAVKARINFSEDLTIAKIGLDGMIAFWLIAQHADRDLSFQTNALEVLRTQASKQDDGKLLPYIAALTDRIAVNRNIPQTFGTQLRTQNGINKLWPVKDVDALDQLRKKMGLEPIDVYLKRMKVTSAT